MDKQELVKDLEDLKDEIECWAQWFIQEKINEMIEKYNKPPAKALTRDEISFEGESD
jgi:hypothetical protein